MEKKQSALVIRLFDFLQHLFVISIRIIIRLLHMRNIAYNHINCFTSTATVIIISLRSNINDGTVTSFVL